MTPIQQLMLGTGSKKKVYIDDVFSTFLYAGTSSARSINNGIDLAGKGGMVWTKSRSHGLDHYLGSPALGTNKVLRTNTSGSLDSGYSSNFTAFNNNGFSLGSDGITNSNTYTYSSWTFRKSSMFDVVTYTGTGQNTNNDGHLDLNHSLKSVPGMIIVKRTSGSSDWWVWHRDLATNNAKAVFLNKNDSIASHSSYWNGTGPTASQFTVGEWLNSNGSTYVAYLFGGGESPAATARSIYFNSQEGIAAGLTIPDHSDLAVSTGDFTIEGWYWRGAENDTYFQINGSSSDTPGLKLYDDEGKIKLYMKSQTNYVVHGGTTVVQKTPKKQWFHLAMTRNGNWFRIFLDGVLTYSFQNSGTIKDVSSTTFCIGCANGGSQGQWVGFISNFRLVKGTAVYTASFKPPTEPLTNITNTKLLCCNNSSTSGSTVTPATITAFGDATARTDSPFDDPAAFTFGDEGDQNVVKCGKWIGDGTSTPPEINLGWEPQFIMWKCTDLSEPWYMADSMRGIVSAGNDNTLLPSSYQAENVANWNLLDLTATGFTLKDGDDKVNGNGHEYIYLAIRRSDGYVGKPIENGTDAFAMDTGNGNSSIPVFDSGFPVDFALYKPPASTENFWTAARLTGTDYLATNTTAAKGTNTQNTWDSNVGWGKQGFNNSYQSWLWKRHAGFDVVTYRGSSNNLTIPHSLSKVPEMIWIKNRSNNEDWYVYHKRLNFNWYVRLNTEDQEQGSSNFVGNPTSTHVELAGSEGRTNNINNDYIMMLFATTDVSKVGNYQGTASGGSNFQTISGVGFQPRFLIMKNVSDSNRPWVVLDTLRGWPSGGGADSYLKLNDTASQNSYNYGHPIADGFTLDNDSTWANQVNKTYIYYAHA